MTDSDPIERIRAARSTGDPRTAGQTEPERVVGETGLLDIIDRVEVLHRRGALTDEQAIQVVEAVERVAADTLEASS